MQGANRKAIIDFSVRPIFDHQGEVTLLVPEGRDITQQKQREKELRETKSHLQATVTEKERQNRAFERFLDIVNDSTLSFDQQISELLGVGVDYLDLDIGILSHIEPPDYTVRNVVTPDGSITQGEVLDFRNTYCSLVYEADGPVSFHSPTDGGIKDHPAYQDLGLEAYLGEPVFVEDNRYGTLNFSSPNSRQEPFTDGEQAFIRTVAEWISEELSRREDEQEITRLNQLHQTVLSNIRESVLVTDDDGQFTYICPNVHFIFGYDAEEVANLGTIEALFGERIIEPNALGTDGEVTNIETALTDKHGADHTVLVTVRQVDIENGSRLYSIRDITERKDWERELRERNHQLQGVLDSVQASIWIRDLDSRFKLINQNFRDLFGFADDTEIVGNRPSELFSDEVAAQFRNNDQQVIETEEPAEIQEEVKTEQGLRTYLIFYSHPTCRRREQRHPFHVGMAGVSAPYIWVLVLTE